jgi:hypothetical protein
MEITTIPHRGVSEGRAKGRTFLKEDELVTMKVRAADREWLKDEQYRIRRSEHVELTHSEIFTRMRQSYCLQRRMAKAAAAAAVASSVVVEANA